MLTKTELGKMNKTKLLEKVEDYGLNDKITDESTNKEIVEVILEFVNGQKEDEPIVEEEPINETAKPKTILEKYGVKTFKLLPKTVKAKLQKEDLLRKEEVIITDMDNSQTRVDTKPISWGNELIGYFTDMVQFDTEDGIYIRRGAIKKMEEGQMTITTKKNNINAEGGSVEIITTKTQPRFRIIRLQGMTEEERIRLATEQATKKAYATTTI